MKNKSILKSSLRKKDVDILIKAKNDLHAMFPVWKLMARLFTNYNKNEYIVLVADLHFLLNHISLHNNEINLSYLLSLQKSAGLMVSRFNVEHLEVYHPVYECLTEFYDKIGVMYEELTEPKDDEE